MLMKRLAFILLFSFVACSLFAVNIEDTDKNFRIETVGNAPVKFLNALEEPFALEGLPWREPGGPIFRIPKELRGVKGLGGVNYHGKQSSGAVVRFKTNSKNIYIRSMLKDGLEMPHMPKTGSSGFDFFMELPDGKDSHLKVVRATIDNVNRKTPVDQKIASFPDKSMRDFALWLPLYGSVETLEIGIDKDAKVLPPRPHKIEKPIVFYGSSITQGACASRTGNAYTTMLCRAVDAEQINLGFSGSAKGEPSMAKAIASLDMSVFVYDYDFNAPDAKHLAKTHEPFFLEIRKAHPNLPVIMLSRCSHRQDSRRDIVKRTYENALKRGDKNVYFIDGMEFFGGEEDVYATVDNTHPNDLGFYLMFKRILPVLKKALETNK